MKCEVKYSGEKLCLNCGAIVRFQYLDGEQTALVDAEALCQPTEKNPNPVYRVHTCEEQGED